jgi:hypothetical protein
MAALAIAIVAILAMNAGGDTTTVKPESSASSGSSRSATPTRSSSRSATPTVSPSASVSTKRPVTLDLRLNGDSFVTVRAPGGHMFLAKLMHKGDHRSFDNKTLVVVLGNAAAVEVRVNGKLRPRGGRGQVARFVAQRK